MLPVYSNIEEIKTTFTYKEWLKEYNRRESKRRIRKRTKYIYYMKQRLFGAVVAVMGIVALFILNDATFSLVALPLGIFLLLTEEKVITF